MLLLPAISTKDQNHPMKFYLRAYPKSQLKIRSNIKQNKLGAWQSSLGIRVGLQGVLVSI